MKKSTTPRRLLATGLEENDVRYATVLTATDPFALVVDGGRLHLLVSSLEAARAQAACPAATVHTSADLFGAEGAKRRRLSEQVAALLERLGRRTAEVGAHFPLGIARALEAAGVEVRLSSAPAFPRRAVKSAAEIAAIARSQRAALAAVRAAIGCLRAAEIAPNGTLRANGRTLTSEAVKALIERTLLERGCSAEGTIVAPGPQGARPHDEGSGPLRAGEPIVLDVFPRDKRTGYWGDVTRTVVRGRASDAVRRMYRAVRDAQALALSLVRPGAEPQAVQRAVEDFFRREGFETRLSPPGAESGFFHGVGHGLGLDVHESPGLRNEAGRLSVGNVLTVEPGLYYPGIGGVRIEDVVVVTPGGHKVLAPFSRKMEYGGK